MSRGPAYPYIDLKKAIVMAKKAYDFAKRSSVPSQALIVDAWEFSAKSSSGVKTLAALKYFGLLDEIAGNSHKNVKISDRAYRILFDSADSPERHIELREAALAPKHYRYCWDTFGSEFPPAMRSKLIFERGFIDSTVDVFLRDYKATVEFAGLDESNNSDVVEAESVSSSIDELPLPSIETKKQVEAPKVTVVRQHLAEHVAIVPQSNSDEVRQETFTLDEGDVVLQWPINMSEESFEDFSDWLELMKRTIKRRIPKSL